MQWQETFFYKSVSFLFNIMKKIIDDTEKMFYNIFGIIEMEVIVMNTETNITPINEDLNVVKYEATNIKNLIYCIRGKQVILDRDLAELYNCKNGTKTINQAVKRNIKRFPERFMFQLSENEYNYLRSQIGTAK